MYKLTVENIKNAVTVQNLKGADVKKSQPFEAILLIRSVSTRTARNGNPFLSVELGDKTGTFNFTCFSDSPLFMILPNMGEGSIVFISGEADHYQGRFSPKVNTIEEILEGDLPDSSIMDKLVETAPRSVGDMMKDLDVIIEGISHPKLKATIAEIFKTHGESFKESTAAISMHHSYRNGLLEHTLGVANVCKALLPFYPEVNGDLALTGAILHDIGKVIEYEGQLSYKKSRAGILQGHIVLGYKIIRGAALKVGLDEDSIERLEHIILSHQGELEWGAAAMAATPEAVFVSMADNLDARMGAVQGAMRKAQEGDEFTERMFSLKTNLLLTPPILTPKALESESRKVVAPPPVEEKDDSIDDDFSFEL